MSLLSLFIAEPTTCGQEMGLRDGFIEDFQLSSSTEDPQYPNSAVRQGGSGWCSDIDEENPYFQV